MRVVVDTNILVSFAIRPNKTFDSIFDHIAEQGVTLVSEDTLAELADVLTREKFRKYIPFSRVIRLRRMVCGGLRDCADH
jgi:uncharacterized protein